MNVSHKKKQLYNHTDFLDLPPLERDPSLKRKKQYISPSSSESEDDPEDHIPFNLPRRNNPVIHLPSSLYSIPHTIKIKKLAEELNSLSTTDDFKLLLENTNAFVQINMKHLLNQARNESAAETRKRNIQETKVLKQMELQKIATQKENTMNNRKRKLSLAEKEKTDVLDHLYTSKMIAPSQGKKFYIGISVLAAILHIEHGYDFDISRNLLEESFSDLETTMDAQRRDASWNFHLYRSQTVYHSSDSIVVPYFMNELNFEKIQKIFPLDRLLLV